jgi:hypothetical protein
MSEFPTPSYTVESYPFRSVGQGLAFYNGANPARAISINLLEPERRGRSQRAEDGSDLWAATTLAIAAALDGESPEARLCFGLRNFGDRTGQKAPEDIAKKIGRSVRTVRRHIARIRDAVEAEFVRRQLLAPLDDGGSNEPKAP